MIDSDGPLTWNIGSVRVTRVEESVVPVPWSGLVPGGADRVDACRPWIDPHVDEDGGHLLLSIHSFVVETPQNCIVVDTCIGRDDLAFAGDAAFGERLTAALPAGVEGVDVVVCTHLHFDHIGWNTVEVGGVLLPRFPNARYLVSRDELAADRDAEDTRAFVRSVEPLRAAGCLEPVAGDQVIDPWVALEPTPGHTPGHVSVRIVDGEATAVITGDLAHSPLQLAYPDTASVSDHDRRQATATRARLVGELAGSDTLVLGTHFPPPTGGRLVPRGDLIAFESGHDQFPSG